MKWFFLFLICTNNLFASAADQDSSSHLLPLVAYWSKGDEINFTITKTRRDSSRNKAPKVSETTHTAKIKVLDSTATSYTLAYSRDIDLDLSENEQKIFSKSAQRRLKDLSRIHIEYETNETGKFQNFINKDHILKSYETSVQVIMKEFLKNIPEKKAKEEFKQLFEQMLSKITTDQLLNMYGQDVLLLHHPLGYEWSTKDTISYEEEIEVPILDINLPANAVWYCAELEIDSGYVTFIDEKMLDPDLFRYGLRKFISEMNENIKKSEPLNFPEDLSMSIYFKNFYTYDIFQAYPLAVTNYKEIESEHDDVYVSRIETYSIFLDDVINKKPL